MDMENAGENSFKQRDFTDSVPREMYDAAIDEVRFLRTELGKTRDLFCELIKFHAAKNQCYENTQQLIIDRLKADGKAENIAGSSNETQQSILNSSINIPNCNDELHCIPDCIPDCIPNCTDDGIQNVKPSGDWAHSSASNESDVEDEQRLKSSENISPSQSFVSQRHPAAQLDQIRSLSHAEFMRQRNDSIANSREQLNVSN